MSLADIALNSVVHQILLSKGEIDRVPSDKINAIKSLIPGGHKLWLERDINELLSTRFAPEVFEAFQKIKPLAYKADLARYCILYIFGGWYFDLTAQVVDVSVLDNYNEDSQVILFRDVPMSGEVVSVGNTVMWFKHPGHEILLNAINDAVANILAEDYTHHQHGITGPIVLGSSVVDYQRIDKHSNILVGDTVMVDNHPTHIFNTTSKPEFLVFSRRRALDSNLADILPSGYESSSNYWVMYHNRAVY